MASSEAESESKAGAREGSEAERRSWTGTIAKRKSQVGAIVECERESMLLELETLDRA